MANIITYEKETETIRQMPQNYLIAHKVGNRWVCDPDMAADHKLATKVFKALLIYQNRYGSGVNLINQA